VEAAGLASATWAGLAEPRGGDHGRSVHGRLDDLELAPLADRALVHVAGDDQLGAGVYQGAEHGAAVGNRPLAAPPRGAEQVVVEGDDLQRAGGGVGEHAGGVLDLRLP
jgi:hypothetical protein